MPDTRGGVVYKDLLLNEEMNNLHSVKEYDFVKIRKYIISHKQLSRFQILRHSIHTFYKSHSCQSNELGKEPRRIILTVSCGSFMPGKLILFITNASGTDRSFSQGCVAVVV